MRLERFVRIAARIGLLVAGTLLVPYWLAACTYQGDYESDTSVRVAGEQIDATFAALVAAVIAPIAFWLAVRALRSSP